MLGWDACTQEPSLLLRWIECHPGAAGWAQAMGAILAIVAAVVVSRMQIAEDRQRNAQRIEAKAKTLAIQLIPFVAHAIVDARIIRGYITNQDHGIDLLTSDEADAQAAVCSMSFRHVPDWQNLSDLDVLAPETAVGVVALFSFLDHFNTFIANYLPAMPTSGDDLRTVFKDDVDQQFNNIEQLAADVSARLEAVMGPGLRTAPTKLAEPDAHVSADTAAAGP